MKKTVQYKETGIDIPSSLTITTTRQGCHLSWIRDNYFLGELCSSNYDMNLDFYNKCLKLLLKGKKKENKNIYTYEWKEFLLFIFTLYQKASKQKLIPRARAKAVRIFLEDFASNIIKLNRIDKMFDLKAKSDKIFYLKKDGETYLLGFLIDKKLIITFSFIKSHLTEKYVNTFTINNVRVIYINNFRDYFLFFLYKVW